MSAINVLARVFKEIDIFPLVVSLKYRGHNSFKTMFGASMTTAVVILVLIYGCISYTELSGSIASYTVLRNMNKLLKAEENRIELAWAFMKQDNLREIVRIDPRIAELTVKRLDIEPLRENPKINLDLFGCDDVYTCVDVEELKWKGTVSSQYQSYISVEMIPCSVEVL